MVIKHDPRPLVLDYKKRINLKLERGGPISAFLLLCGYMEGFLKEFLLISESETLNGFSKQILSKVETMPFSNLILFHIISRNIDSNLYIKLTNFQTYRNKMVHRLHMVDIEDKKHNREFKNKIKDGLEICNKIEKRFNETLDRRAEEIT